MESDDTNIEQIADMDAIAILMEARWRVMEECGLLGTLRRAYKEPSRKLRGAQKYLAQKHGWMDIFTEDLP